MAQWNPNLPTLQQSLPGLQGARAGQNLMRGYLQNRAQRQRNLSQPGMTQAKLAQMMSQEQASKARVPLLQAQTETAQFEAQHAPEFLDIKKQVAANALRNVVAKEEYTALQRQKMTSLMGNMLNRMSNSAAGKQFLSENPGFARNLLEGMQGASQQFAQQAQQPVPGMGQPAMQQPQGVMGAQPPEQPVQPMHGQMPAQLPSVSDEEVRRAQEATADRQVKDRTDMQTRNQKRFSTVLNSIVSKREKDLPRLFSKYVGAANKPKYLAGLKAGDQDALAFRSFMKTDIPQIANELKRTMGGQATDQETRLMESIVNPDWWFGDARQAISQWNSFIENNRLIEKGLDIPLRDLFKKDGGRGVLSRASPGAVQSPSITAAPPGTVEMIEQNGKYRAVPHADVDAAIKYGWRRANG